MLFFATAISAFVVTPAYAEVDPAVLNAILNQLAGDHETATGTTTSTGTTTVTSTGTTTTTTPPASANSADHLEISMSPTGKI